MENKPMYSLMRKLLLFFLIALFVSCFSDGGRIILFEVTGSATSFDVTITKPDGNSTQYNSVVSGASWEFKGFPGDYVYMSGKNRTNQGNVEVSISVDGATFMADDSSGAYALASVHGNLP